MDNQKSFETNLTDKQYFVMRLEILVDEMTNTLGKVKHDTLKGYDSLATPTLTEQYLTALSKSASLNLKGFELTGRESTAELCNKVETYIAFLQLNGIAGFGKEDFKL